MKRQRSVARVRARAGRLLRLSALAAMLIPGGATLSEEADWVGKAAPEIAAGAWLNSKPLTLAGLRGRVVVVEFWTFACGNCRNTLRHVREWKQRHRADEFEVIAVHTPELPRERDLDALRREVDALEITWPVVTDNAYATWNAYHQRYWPVWYVIDKRGVIRYVHVGEGGYDETERIIRQLLS
ncbi:MAG TPA: redoxin domain-containing protein [Bacteroidota bacterium]|nr:redoxin domain-containing protein [Bacteroidota bacterium]